MKFDMTPCKSSSVEEHGYDAASKTLAVKFKSGQTYHYQDIPQSLYESMCGAESVGKFFASTIRRKFAGKQPKGD